MDFTVLRRAPDLEGDGLAASDAAGRLLLDEASAPLAALAASGAPDPGARVVVIGDTHGALALGTAVDHGLRGIRVHQDALLGERAIAANAARMGLTDAVRIGPLDAELVAGAEVVLLRLPRSLDALDEIAELIGGAASSGVVVYAGGRLKHMTTAMNEVLLRRFERVDVTHARQKSRVLIASGVRGMYGVSAVHAAAEAGPPGWPRTAHDAALDLDVVAHGGVFAGTSVDIGTRFLLEVLGPFLAAGRRGGEAPDIRLTSAIDLACGSGIVAVRLARLLPEARIAAYDQSAAAVASACATAQANGLADRIDADRADALELVPDATARLVVLNPPFHSGPALTTRLAEHLFAEAGRALAPGGRLVAVWNSHLRYRPALERLVGPTRQLARNAKFTVTVSTR